jgi:hypothetical protein
MLIHTIPTGKGKELRIQYVRTRKGYIARNGEVKIAEITKRGRGYQMKHSRGIGELEREAVNRLLPVLCRAS